MPTPPSTLTTALRLGRLTGILATDRLTDAGRRHRRVPAMASAHADAIIRPLTPSKVTAVLASEMPPHGVQ